MAKKRGPNQVQREGTRGKLVEAAISLIAERGPLGFAMAEVAPRAGLGRALIGYHFKNRADLLEAAVRQTIEADPLPGTAGLKALLDRFEDQLTRAEDGDPNLLAMLRVASDATADPEISAIRHALRRQHAGLIQRQLESAEARGEIPAGLSTTGVAPTLLALLHGELLRITAGSEPAGVIFLLLLERALVSTPTPAKTKAPVPSRSTPQLDIFAEAGELAT